MKLEKDFIESLPVTIELAGIAIIKSIFINEERLIYKHSEEAQPINFDWGRSNQDSMNLAKVICSKYELGQENAKDIELYLVQQLRAGNFKMTFKFQEFLLILSGITEGAKPIAYFFEYDDKFEDTFPQIEAKPYGGSIGLGATMAGPRKSGVILTRDENGNYDAKIH